MVENNNNLIHTFFDTSLFDEKSYFSIVKFVSSILCDCSQMYFNGPLKTYEDFQSIFIQILNGIRMCMNIRIFEIVQGMVLLNRIYQKYKGTESFHGSNSVNIIFYFVCCLILVCLNYLYYFSFYDRQINVQMINHIKMEVGQKWVFYPYLQ
jgi:heme/copper-type cytochrome/quinol oxidase subunit 2